MRKHIFLLVFLLIASTFSLLIQPMHADPQPGAGSSRSVGVTQQTAIQFIEESDYISLNNSVFVLEFYKDSQGYNKVFDRDGTILVYDDRLILEYFKTGPDTWNQRGIPISVTWVKVDDYHYNVTRLYDDYLGTTYNVTYIVKYDFPIKIVIDIACGQTDDYRISWNPSGITRDLQSFQGNGLVFSNAEVDSEEFYVEFNWADVQESFGNIIESSVETVAQGKKANIHFTIGTLTEGQIISVDPSIIGTSTYAGSAYRSGDKSAWHSASLYWEAYCDGTNLVYRSSPNGSSGSWSSATTIRAGNAGSHLMEILVDGNNIHYAIGYGAIYYRKGTCHSNGTITWFAAEQTALGESAYDPDIAEDSNGKLWIVARVKWTDPEDFVTAIRSSTSDGTWTQDLIYNVSEVDGSWYSHIQALGSGKMLVLWQKSGYKVNARLYNGSGWESSATVSDYDVDGTHYAVEGNTTHVYLAYCNETSRYLLFNTYTDGLGWGSEETVRTGNAASTPALSVDTQNDEIYYFWAENLTQINYKVKNSSELWETTVEWISLTTRNLTDLAKIQSYSQDHDLEIGLRYQTNDSSPYELWWANLTVTAANSDPTVSSFTSPSTVYADELFDLTGTINDDDGVADFVNCTITLDDDGGHTFSLKWINSTNVFSEDSDPSNFVTFQDGTRTTVNSTAYTLTWNFLIRDTFPEATVDVVSLVFDSSGSNGTTTDNDLFTFDHGEEGPSGTSSSSTPSTPSEPEETILIPGVSPVLQDDGGLGVNPMVVGIAIVVGIVVFSAYTSSPSMKTSRKKFKKKRKPEKVKWKKEDNKKRKKWKNRQGAWE